MSKTRNEKSAAMTMPREDRERVALTGAALEGGAPDRVHLAPWGKVISSNGSFVLDEDSAADVLSAFEAHGTDLPIDYEHQSLGGSYASPSGQAPAAGWIRTLRLVTPEQAGAHKAAGLWAEVTWTDAGRAKLTAREYRYISPVVIVRKQDRRMVALHSAALTNKPAIVGMTPLVNHAEPVGDGAMEGEVLCALRERLDLPEDASRGTVLVAARERMEQLLEDRALREAEQRIDEVMRVGKLMPRQRKWALDLAMRDADAFDRWAEAAPVILPPGRMAAPDGTCTGARNREAVAASARSRYRSEPALAALTDEEAWVRLALRDAGLAADEA